MRQQPSRSSSFFSAPPGNLELDITGLVESQIMDAQDWLTCYEGPDELTNAEAFEGIERLFRLVRTQPDLLSAAGGDDVLIEIKSMINSNASRFAQLAAQFPNVDAWITQFDEAWESNSEDDQQAVLLLEDAEAIDAVLWYCSAQGIEEVFSDHAGDHENQSLTSLVEMRNKIQLRIGKFAGFFILCEAHVRATCETIRVDFEDSDPTGWMRLSAAMYLPLLQAADEVWDNATSAVNIFDTPQWQQLSSPLGGMAMDYARVPVMASAAGAEAKFRRVGKPFVWHSRQDQMMAEMYRPPALNPAGDTQVRIDFYADREGNGPAESLIGVVVQLGGASGKIFDLRQDSSMSISATLVYEQITAMSESQIELTVGNQVWRAVND